MRVSWRRPAAVWVSRTPGPGRLRPRRHRRPVGFQDPGVWGLDSGEAGCSSGLSTADPFAGAITEPLVLPDGHLVLQRVDERAAGLERLTPVWAGHRHHHGEIADGQVPDAVHRGQREHAELGRYLLGHPAKFRFGRGVRAVREADHAVPAVLVANRAGEQGDRARARVADRGPYLIHGQRFLAHLGEPDHVHASHRTRIGAGRASSVLLPGTLMCFLMCSYVLSYVLRLRRRAARTIAAVPITATVAPAAVMVASFLGRRRPAARWLALASISAWSTVALSYAGCQPASRSVWQSTTHG